MIDYQWIKSKRKTIAIQIKEHGQIIVKSPYGVSRTEIESFIHQKQAWIEKHRMMILEAEKDRIQISDVDRFKGIEKAKEVFPQRERLSNMKMISSKNLLRWKKSVDQSQELLVMSFKNI